MSYQPSPKYGPLPPWQITRDRFHELLNVLPPGRHTYTGQCERFYLIERMSGDIVLWAVRVGAERGTPAPLYFAFQVEATISAYDLDKIVDLAVSLHRAGRLPQTEEEVLAGVTK